MGVPAGVPETEKRARPARTRIQVRGELTSTLHVLTEAPHSADEPLAIDLGHVTFPGTSPRHALPGHELVLAGPLTPEGGRLLDTTGTDHLFTFTPTA
ncbi:hypothetical protein [Streptomyces sp. NPDC091027]|uniref:hypothetical protein n=1 Tax=Streptomyces sp. NPDC091027 TaxID=3365971 RepID=UPI0037FCB9EB